MYLLSGQSLATADWFRPESMALNLEERKSTATITVGPEAPAIQVGAWLRDDQEPGNGIIWRVKSVETQYHTNSRTIQLEHIVNTLRDGVMFGEVTPKTITGNNSATTCTAKKAMQYILGRQDIWTLGTFDSAYSDVTNPYNFNGDGLFAALETVTASLDDAHWEYDLSSLPFKLKILSAGSDVDSEMRMSRNIRTIRRTVDRSRMFTRLYPIGENNLHITGDYVSRNEATYGTICKIETESSKKDKAELKRWALERLKNHCEPTVTIMVDGLDLSQDTGEPLDRLTICRKCRVPLPEFGTTITEKITKLSWSDKIREPKKVAVTLANNREDIASIINKQNAKGGGGARAKAKKDEEDHAWIDDTTEHVQLVAEAIIGHGPDGVDWSRVATLGVDGEGIHGRVTRAEGYMVTLSARLDMTEERLTIAFENAIASTRSEFAMTAESLRIGFENDLASTRSEFLMTSESLRVQFENDLASTRSEFQMTSESLRVQFESDLSSTRSEFQMTSESLRVQFEAGQSSLRSSIQAEAGRIGLIVEGYGNNAQIKRAAIVASINENAESTVTISADKVNLEGYVKATDITTDYLSSIIANIQVVSVSTLAVSNTINSAGYVYAPEFVIGSNSSQGGSNKYVSNAITSLQVVSAGNNAYKIQKKSFGDSDWVDVTGTFSRATSLSGAWSGSEPKTLTVSASPQGENYYQYFTTGAKQNQDGSAYSSGNEWYVPVYGYEQGTPPAYNQILRVAVDASSIWTNGFNAGVPTGATLGTKVTGTTWNVNIARGSYTAVGRTIDLANAYTDARDGYYTKAQYDANWDSGFAAGVPTGATLGTKVTGTTWNVSIARGSYAAVGKTIDLANAYTDARSGYYTQAQYDANWTAGFNAGVPTGATLGTKVTGTTWNVSIARGSYAAVGKTINLANAYTDARSGYYTQAQYDAALATVPAGYFNSANLSFDCTDLGSSAEGNDKKITGTAKNGSTTLGTGTQTIHMGTGSWSSGKIGVTSRMSNSSGKVICRVYVNMPTSATWTKQSLGTGNQWKLTCTVGGKAYTKTCTASGGISW